MIQKDVLHFIQFQKKESRFKLCRVLRVEVEKNSIPYLLTHDGRKIRYPDPDIKVNDTIKVNIESGKITKFVKFEIGNLCYVTSGHSRGRIGEIFHREKHLADFDIIHVRDITGEQFTTRIDNVFVIGPGHTSWITLPKGLGVKLSTIEDRKRRLRFLKESKKGKKSKKVTKKIADKKAKWKTEKKSWWKIRKKTNWKEKIIFN